MFWPIAARGARARGAPATTRQWVSVSALPPERLSQEGPPWKLDQAWPWGGARQGNGARVARCQRLRLPSVPPLINSPFFSSIRLNTPPWPVAIISAEAPDQCAHLAGRSGGGRDQPGVADLGAALIPSSSKPPVPLRGKVRSRPY